MAVNEDPIVGVEIATEAALFLAERCLNPPPVAVGGVMTNQMGAMPTAGVGHILRLLMESEGGAGATHTTTPTARLTATIPRLQGEYPAIMSGAQQYTHAPEGHNVRCVTQNL